MSVDLYTGMRVREDATGQAGVVEQISYDNSCSDPDCCGGPYPDTAYIRFECGHMHDVSSRYDGGWDGFSVLAPPPTGDDQRGRRDWWPLRPIRDISDLRRLLNGNDVAALALTPDAHGTGVVVRHADLGPIARVGWGVIKAGALVREDLETVAPLLEVPLRAIDELPLTSPQAGQAVIDVATGVRGVIEEVYIAPDGQEWNGVAYAKFECGHAGSFLLDEQGTVEDLALVPDAR
jgi:hypothetical protein